MRNVFFDPLKLDPVVLRFVLFPDCHAFQACLQASPVYLLRLVARPDREFSRRICAKCPKFGRNSQRKSVQKLENGRKSTFPCSRIYLNSSLVPLKLFKNIHCDLKPLGSPQLCQSYLGRSCLYELLTCNKAQLNTAQSNKKTKETKIDNND